MNIDRKMLTVAIIVIAALWYAMYVSGIASQILWWKIPLALVVGFGLQAVLGAARRRKMLRETTAMFLGTVPLAVTMTLVIGIDQNISVRHLLYGFLFVESVFLVLSFGLWLLGGRESEAL